MEHKGTYKIVRLLQPGTKLFAIDDDDNDVEGVVEAYRFIEYTQVNGQTSHDVEYRIKWDDGAYEWISWSSANEYFPQRPKKPTPYIPREVVNV